VVNANQVNQFVSRMSYSNHPATDAADSAVLAESRVLFSLTAFSETAWGDLSIGRATHPRLPQSATHVHSPTDKINGHLRSTFGTFAMLPSAALPGPAFDSHALLLPVPVGLDMPISSVAGYAGGLSCA
jgi:hypothetical protein